MAKKRPRAKIGITSGRYTARACILWCVCDHTSQALEEFEKKRRWRYVDRIRVFGGAKTIGAPTVTFERAFVLSHIRQSILAHAPKVVILMIHLNCPAYSKPEEANDRTKLSDDLVQAMRILRAQIPPDIQIEGVLVDSERIWQVT